MISFIQIAGGTPAGAAVNAPFGANVTQGDLLLAFLQVTNVTVTSITDGQGNVWSISQNHIQTEVGSPFNIVSAWAFAKATGPCTVTWNMSAAGGGVLFANAVQYHSSNSWASNPVTTSAYQDCNTGNPNTVGAMTGGKAGSLAVLWGALYTTGCVWSTTTPGYTLRTGGAGGSVTGLCDSVLAATGPTTPQLTLATNQNSFALGFILDEIRPAQNLTPKTYQIAMQNFSILPIEEE